MKFSDIKLTEEDYALIEHQINEVEAKDYGGHMPANNKRTLRAMLVQQTKEGIWSNRDYVYGLDEGGEPPEIRN